MEPLEARLMLSGTPFGQYTSALYPELLDRSIDEPSWHYWSDQLARGVTHQTVASAISRSNEAGSHLASDYYTTYLGRAISPAEQSERIRTLAVATPQQFLRDVLGSPEYFAGQGGTNDSFIGALYQDLLGRAAGASEVGYWTERLQSAGRTAVSDRILRSTEYTQSQVRAWYDALLGRPADQIGLVHWSQALQSGIDERDVESALLSSPEYRARVEFAGIVTPGSAGDLVETTLSWGGQTSLRNELGWYVADDFSGRVSGVLPGQPGFVEAVLRSPLRQTLFSQAAFPHGNESAVPPYTDSKTVDLPGGSFLGLYLIQNDTAASVLAQLPTERNPAMAKVFFSLPDANPGRAVHVAYRGADRLGFEDLDQESDLDFNDAVLRVEFGAIVPPQPSQNVPPRLTPIADQTTDELSPFVIRVSATDAPGQPLTYSLTGEVAERGAVVNPQTGEFTWTPREEDGPGAYVARVRVTDNGSPPLSDETEFTIEVHEVNAAPVLADVAGTTAYVDEELVVTHSAADPDLPANGLTYALVQGPAEATIDPETGELRWTPAEADRLAPHLVTVRVTDDGQPARSDEVSYQIDVEAAPCGFDPALSGWTVRESGGEANAGTAATPECAAVLREGDSFVVELKRSFIVPQGAGSLSFVLGGVAFDQTDSGFVRDAFEAALLADNGNSLVPAFEPDRDAFLNTTEGLNDALGAGVTRAGDRITVPLDGVLPGTVATLVFRLANNDNDRASNATIQRVEFPVGAAFVPVASRARELRAEGEVLQFDRGNLGQPAWEGAPAMPMPFLTAPTVNEIGAGIEWEKHFPEYVAHSPVIIDLNQDHIAEIIFVSGATLYAIDGKTGAELWTTAGQSAQMYATGGLATGDLDGDGFAEIVGVSLDAGNQYLVAINADGTFRWRSDAALPSYFHDGQNWGAPALADLDADGRVEVVFGADVFDSEGQHLWHGEGGSGNGYVGPLSVVVDLNLDGIPEVLAGRTAYRSDGSVYWNAKSAAGVDLPDGFPAVADFNNDGTPEVVLVSNGTTYLLDRHGAEIWHIDSGARAAPAIADFDGDGEPEIAAAGISSYQLIETDGTPKWPHPLPIGDPTGVSAGSVAFDVDGDGAFEIAYGDTAHLYILRGSDGQILFQLPKPSSTWYEAPAIADVDGDGHVEIVVGTATQLGGDILVIGGPSNSWNGSTTVWNQNSYHGTNVSNEGRIPGREANSFQSHNSYRAYVDDATKSLGPPSIVVNSSESSYPAGLDVVLVGKAVADQGRGLLEANRIVAVTVNGMPVDVLDADGRFFAQVKIHAGENRFEFFGTDAFDQSVRALLIITGNQPQPGRVDWSQYADVTGSFAGVYGRTSFQEAERLLHVNLASLNEGPFETQTPLLVGVRNFSDPAVQVVGSDGLMPDGTPYFDFSRHVNQGRLKPGEVTASPAITLFNPRETQFTYDLVFYGKLNAAPMFTSLPDVEALAGRPYRYDANATDSDEDALAYSLLAHPPGMTINAVTGALSWSPSEQALGSQSVSIQVSDGRGGVALQSFVVSVVAAPPNRPPVITSEPVALAHVGSAYAYAVQAIDADGDSLNYSLSAHPSGMTIDASTGMISWTAGAGQLGENDVEVVVSDARGGTATQMFCACVTSDPANHPPVIVSAPVTSVVALAFADREVIHYQDEWRYQVVGIGEEDGFELPAYNDGAFAAGLGGFGSGGGCLLNQTARNTLWPTNSDLLLRKRIELPRGASKLTVRGAIDNDIQIFVNGVDISQGVHTSEGCAELNEFSVQAPDDLLAVGANLIAVRARDRGSEAYVDVVISVEAPIDWTPGSPDVDSSYFYEVEAADPDSDVLTYELMQSPAGMTIDANSGELRWAPSHEDEGEYPVSVRVSDGRGGSDEQTFVVSAVDTGGRIEGSKWNDVNGDGARGGRNQVGNFDFESGNTGFLTDLVESSNLYPADVFFIGTNPSHHHGAFVSIGDHTTGDGRMMIINGLVNSDHIVWGQDLAVRPNTEYRFGVWATSVHPSNPARIQFFVNGAMIGADLQLSSNVGEWQYLSATWNSGASTLAALSIHNYTSASGGNDFALDDIEFLTTESEPSLSEWQIYIDQNRNGFREESERWTTTDSEGNYAFDDLGPGEYWLAEELRPGWRQTFPADRLHHVTITGTDTVVGMDFGNSETGDLGNRAPEVTSMPAISAAAESLFRYPTIAFDADGDRMHFALSLAPDGMTVHSATGAVVWSPTLGQVGSHQVVLRVEDGRGGAATQAFSIDVLPANTPPSFSSTPPVGASSTGLPYEYRAHAQDADGDAITYRLAISPEGMTIDTDTGLVSWVAAAAGEFAVEIVAEDERGGSSKQAFTLSVADGAGNSPPVIATSAPTSAVNGMEYAYLIEAADPNGDPLRYALDLAPAGATLEPQPLGGALLRWTPGHDSLATQAFRIHVSDWRGAIATQSFAVEVRTIAANQPPGIISTPPLRALIDALYRYDAVARDPEGQEILWRLVVAPAGLSVDPERGTLRWTPDMSQLGEHEVVLQALDAGLEVAEQRFTISVACVNLPPAIVSTPLTSAAVDTPYLYPLRAQDAEDGPLSFGALSTLPSGMTLNAKTGLIRWTPTADQAGSHTIVVRVVDDAGDQGIQAYTIEVDETPANRPPVISSTPSFNAMAESPYEYQVRARDPEGTALTFGLLSPPAGMEIEPTTGRISWTPALAQAGDDPDAGADYTIIVAASDAGGATATQAFSVRVRRNLPPVIQSTAPIEAVAGAVYRYTVSADDPNDDPLTFALDDAPAGMTIDDRGRILWTPAAELIGMSVPATLRVRDAHGAVAVEEFVIAVMADTAPPEVAVQINRNGRMFLDDATVDIGSQVTIRVVASDNVAVTNVQLTVDGELVALDPHGEAQLTLRDIRNVVARAVAHDAAGNVGQGETTVQVADPANTNRPIPGSPGLPAHPGTTDPSDQLHPAVEITSPSIGSEVKTVVEIVGTVDDPEDNLWYWRLYSARVDRIDLANIDLADADLKLLGEGTQEVVAGKLGEFDPTLLSKDPYALVLAGFDYNGQGYITASIVTPTGNLQLGNFHLDFTDLTVPLAGLPISVSRVYDTLQAADEGDFGYGWSLGVQDARILETVPDGAEFVPALLDPAHATKVYLTNPDGQRVGFTFDPTLQGTLFGAIGTPRFKPDPGVYDTLEVEGEYGYGGVFGGLEGPFNPDTYILTTHDGLKYRYSQSTGLQRIEDPNGNIVTFSRDGVTHSNGESIQFVRDHRGRITRVVDPAGKAIRYEYDLAGNFVRMIDQVGNATRYVYLSEPAHYLDEAYDSAGNRSLKVSYDEDKRYIGVLDALGQPIEVRGYELEERTATIRDGNRNETQLIFNDRGNVLEQLAADGGLTKYEYGDTENPDKETTVTLVYPEGREIVTQYKYDAAGNIIEITDDVGTRTFAYGINNQVTRVSDEQGRATVFDYDGQGNLTTVVNAAGNASLVTYDAQGRPASYTDFNGNTTRFDYKRDSDTQPWHVYNPDHCVDSIPGNDCEPSVRTVDYNAFGQVTRTEDEEGVVSINEYDDAGRLDYERIGQDAPVRYRYDGQNQVERRVAVSEADPTESDRVTKYVYWPTGQLRYEVDPLGTVTGYEYDAAGNRTFLGRWNTEAEYLNDYGAVDGTSSPRAERPRYGHVTFEHVFVYDSMNRVDYELDDVQLALVAANSAYVPLVLNYDYDVAGNRTAIVDREGRRREFEFDDRNRMTVERWIGEDGSSVVRSFTWKYCGCGSIEQATEFDGPVDAPETLSKYTYRYDALRRMTEVDNVGTKDMPRVVFSYEYDANGNRSRVADNLGVAVESLYDNRNRLWKRAWIDTGAADAIDEIMVEFGYYANGVQKSIERFDLDDDLVTRLLSMTPGTKVGETEYGVLDDAGRYTTISHRGPGDSPIADYLYEFDALGLVDRLTYDNRDDQYDFDVDYGYDAIGQLLGADYTDATTGRGIYVDESYAYDRNGNRTNSYLHGDGYSTGTGNRLLSDGTYDYEYDADGNIRFKRRHAHPTEEFTAYHWDHRGRLSKAELSTAGAMTTVEYTYDVDDRRISIVEFGAEAIDSSVTRMASDGDHVHADFDAAGKLAARYLYDDSVDHIIARTTSSEQVTSDLTWYLTDRQGTVQSATDNLATVLFSRQYSSFGIPIGRDSAFDRYAFTAREYNTVIGTYYYRARYYSAEIGRFLSTDPLAFGPLVRGTTYLYRASALNYATVGSQLPGEFDARGFDAFQLHLYQYADNSPLHATDPSGKVELIERGLIDVETLTETGTVAANTVSRPFIKSTLLIRSIIERGIPAADASVPTAFKWVVEGTFNGSRGLYELVIDTATNRILHFLFRTI